MAATVYIRFGSTEIALFLPHDDCTDAQSAVIAWMAGGHPHSYVTHIHAGHKSFRDDTDTPVAEIINWPQVQYVRIVPGLGDVTSFAPISLGDIVLSRSGTAWNYRIVEPSSDEVLRRLKMLTRAEQVDDENEPGMQSESSVS